MENENKVGEQNPTATELIMFQLEADINDSEDHLAESEGFIDLIGKSSALDPSLMKETYVMSMDVAVGMTLSRTINDDDRYRLILARIAVLKKMAFYILKNKKDHAEGAGADLGVSGSKIDAGEKKD